jgi:hypothetical protein
MIFVAGVVIAPAARLPRVSRQNNFFISVL